MFKRSFRSVFIVTLLALLLVACSSVPTGDPTPSEPLSFVVDPHVTPGVAEIEGLEDGDPPRPVAGVMSPEGHQMDFVLGELIVSAESAEALTPFLARWNAVVVDTLEPGMFSEADDPTEFLVRLDPSGADPSRLASDLLKLEPDQQGEYRFGSQAALELLAIAIYESAEHGVEASVNDILYGTSFPAGATTEAPTATGEGASEYLPDATTWPYMNVGSAQNIGVGAAWQLMADEGVLLPETFSDVIPIMIVDGGFFPNTDFPSLHKIRKANWEDRNPMGCGPGNPCPWHGTHVVMAAMARADNQYGAAGPAAPVARLIAVGTRSGRWRNLRQVRQMVEEERPKIVNMSYVSNISIDKSGVRRRHNRHYRAIRNSGALLFAAAGNEGRNADSGALILPCESTHVICVGGMGWDSTGVDAGSNFGTNPNKSITESVELYGPFEIYSIADPTAPLANMVRRVRGTSFASPFVAGIAALVWYANPELTASEVRTVLQDTAHQGGLGSTVTGHQRRVNAFSAVAYALGYQEWSDPSISLFATSATGSVSTGFPLGEEIWFEATAVDHRGVVVPTVTWTIMGQEIETEPSPGGQHIVINDSLDVGSYAITATATDLGGYQATATIDIEVTYEPPEVFITNPKVNQVIWANETLSLAGQGLSGLFPLPEDHLAWRVTSGNTTVHSALGSTSTVPAAVMQPGSYQIRLTGHDNVETVSRSITITAIPKPPDYPTASIISLEHGSVYASGSAITFSGNGTDPEDGILSGTAFRWTAAHPGGEIVLCEGNAFSGQPLPVQNCSSFAATLDGFQPPGAEGTLYTITLEVMDSDGNVDHDTVDIRVVVPPVP